MNFQRFGLLRVGINCSYEVTFGERFQICSESVQFPALPDLLREQSLRGTSAQTCPDQLRPIGRLPEQRRTDEGSDLGFRFVRVP